MQTIDPASHLCYHPHMHSLNHLIYCNNSYDAVTWHVGLVRPWSRLLAAYLVTFVLSLSLANNIASSSEQALTVHAGMHVAISADYDGDCQALRFPTQFYMAWATTVGLCTRPVPEGWGKETC